VPNFNGPKDNDGTPFDSYEFYVGPVPREMLTNGKMLIRLLLLLLIHVCFLFLDPRLSKPGAAVCRSRAGDPYDIVITTRPAVCC
jgi:hypothetical protein